jgi:hypothetical protein
VSTPLLINLGATLALVAALTSLFHFFAWQDPQSHALFTLFGPARRTAALYLVASLCLLLLGFLFLDAGGCADCAVSPGRAYGRARIAVGSEGSSLVFYLSMIVFGSLSLSLALKAWWTARDTEEP